MFARAPLLLLLVLAASCVPQGAARTAATPPEQLSADAFRQLPAAEATQVIDAVTAAGPAARPFAAAAGGNALDCLTEAVYYEARGEPVDGQRAVAQVVLNRVRHPAFPHSICGVVFQGSARATGCQFSFTCDGSMRRGREPGAWAEARRVAAAALSGYVFAPVGLATHFHATYVHPWWAGAMRRAVTVGAHVFYRWPGQWGDPLAFSRPYRGWESGVPAQHAAAAPAWAGDGGELVMGVTIHRGTTAARAPEGGALEMASGGVRVHRGGRSERSAPGVTVHDGGAEAQAALAEGPAPAGGNADAATH